MRDDTWAERYTKDLPGEVDAPEGTSEEPVEYRTYEKGRNPTPWGSLGDVARFHADLDPDNGLEVYTEARENGEVRSLTDEECSELVQLSEDLL